MTTQHTPKIYGFERASERPYYISCCAPTITQFVAMDDYITLKQQHDAALAGLSRLAKYPLTRADELSAEQMRDIARDYMAKAGSASTVEQIHPLDAYGRKCGLWPGCGCNTSCRR